MHSSVVKYQKTKSKCLQNCKGDNQDCFVHIQECSLTIPPEVDEQRVFNCHQDIVAQVLDPCWSFLDIDDIKDENNSQDHVIHKLRHWPPLVIHGATEVSSHAQYPDQHEQVVTQEKHEELTRVDAEKQTENKDSGAESEESPEPLRQLRLQ